MSRTQTNDRDAPPSPPLYLPHRAQFEAHRMRRGRTNVAGATEQARSMAEALARSLEGEVRFDPGDRALYAADASNYRQVPLGVVIPRSIEDVVRAVRVAREHGAAIVPRGGGTSLAGQGCNAALVIDFSKYLDHIHGVDVARRLARVEPGVVLDELRDAATPHGLTFGPDTSTHAWNSLGGMIGNNSCGVRSVLSEFHGPGARTSDHVHRLDVLLYDGTRLTVGETSDEELERIVRAGGRKGEIYGALRALRDRYADRIRERYPKIPRRVSGYNLDDLLPEKGFHVGRALAGSEGTLAVTLGAELILDPRHRVRTMIVLGFEDIYTAGDHVPQIMAHEPTAVEGIDHKLTVNMHRKGLHVDYLKVLPPGKAWLFVEFGGETTEEADAKGRKLCEESRSWPSPPHVELLDDPEREDKAWKVRESGLGATAFVPGEPDHWPGWEDSAVPPDRVGDYYRDIRRLYDAYGYDAAMYGHIGQGVLHTRIPFDLYSAGGIEKFKAFTREAAELVVRKYGGSLSGEHGDGQARGDLLPIMYGEELMQAFREFKAIWDPDGKMNPGKVVDANPRDSHLRLGADYDPPELETHFRFPDDRGSFARATLRCVGVGKCRRQEGGTMCPSFQVLREEKHTTRGRTHLLFEMLNGEEIPDGWRNEEVREALDLCLACKGCKGDCPVNVDVATYKAEFLSHFYEGRLRPRHAYAFGLIEWWARLGSAVPDAVNLLTGTPGAARLAKWAAGIAPQRQIPRFAPVTFRRWWRERARGAPPPRRPGAPRVLVWPDAFNDHFYPEVLKAAVEVLEDAGCEVAVPERWMPAGRPLYDFGMLTLARWQLRRILDGLEEEIRLGTPIVVLEPSVCSIFRDELRGLFPDDERATTLRELALTLPEFLLEHLDGYEPPKLEGEALLHGHCHHKAILELAPEVELLQRMGLQLDMPDTGCCGMAGAFGFAAGEKYELSVARGEQALLPAVRDQGPDALIVADGFSCREQVRQGTGRMALNTAEVVRLALRRQAGDRRAAARRLASPPETSPLLGAAALGGALVLGGAAVRGIAHLIGNGRNGREDEVEAAARRRAAHVGARARGGGGRGAGAHALR